MRRMGNALGRAVTLWRVRAAARFLPPEPPALPVCAMGIRFANPVGLAAGMDRDGAFLPALSACGFGFVEIGTVRPEPHGALGFARVIANLVRVPPPRAVRIGINFASNHDGLTADALSDYITAMRALWPYADYLVANLSGPRAVRRCDAEPTEYARFLMALREEQERLKTATGCSVPLAVKVGIDGARTELLQQLRCAAPDAVIGVTADPLVLADAVGALAPVAVISVGGIRTSADAAERLARGACLLQVFRGLIRTGPLLPRRLVAGLTARAARGAP